MTAPAAIQSPPCPVCGGGMWDETKSQFYRPGKPMWKCKNAKQGCNGVIWPPKTSAPPVKPAVASAPVATPAPAPAAPQEKFAQLNGLFELHDLCLAHAVKQSETIEGDSAEAISARAATLFIAAKDRGLAI